MSGNNQLLRKSISLPRLPEYKGIKRFNYRDQLLDSDAFRDVERWSNRMFCKILDPYIKQTKICFNKLSADTENALNALFGKTEELENRLLSELNQNNNLLTSIESISNNRNSWISYLTIISLLCNIGVIAYLLLR